MNIPDEKKYHSGENKKYLRGRDFWAVYHTGISDETRLNGAKVDVAKAKFAKLRRSPNSTMSVEVRPQRPKNEKAVSDEI